MKTLGDLLHKSFEPDVTIEIQDIGSSKRKLANTILSEIQRFLWGKYSTLVDGERRVIYVKRKKGD